MVQDYALVISSGDGQLTNALTLSRLADRVSDAAAGDRHHATRSPILPGFAGGFLFNQRVGANTPLLGTNTILLPTEANGVLTLGMTNQWHFYAITNNTTYTNAAFLTFLPVNLAVPRMGVFDLQRGPGDAPGGGH